MKKATLIDCRRCGNLLSKEDGCKLYGPDPDLAAYACVHDGCRNYLPFFPGEDVFVVERGELYEPCDVTGYMYLARVEGYAIVTTYLGESEDLEETADELAERSMYGETLPLALFPLCDCYLSAEEAEAVLQDAQEKIHSGETALLEPFEEADT